MKLVPYLTFDGNCAEAFKYYEMHLGGKITFSMTFGEAPGDPPPPEMQKRIMHTTLALGDQVLQGADSPGPYQKPQGITIAIQLKDVAEAERIFKALAEGGDVQMPLQETFWALRFGSMTD